MRWMSGPGQGFGHCGAVTSLGLLFTKEEKPGRLNSGRGRITLKSVLKALVVLHKDRDGQGMVEYLLILALVALAAAAGMKTLANGINSAFAAISSILGTYIT
jgi:Flp pilus assembly pilin Flp